MKTLTGEQLKIRAYAEEQNRKAREGIKLKALPNADEILKECEVGK